MRAFVLTAVLCAVAAGGANAGAIERACNTSNRQAATRAMCNCIGRVADSTLSWSDQRRAAKFFRSPEKAQEMKANDSRSAEAFWERYSAFGARAEAFCGG
mgnify:FL=1